MLAVLILAACSNGNEPGACVEVKGTFNPAAPALLVAYQSGVDPVAATSELEAKYQFRASHIWTAPPGFAAVLSSEALSSIRCEPTVSAIEHDAVAYLVGR